MLAIIAAAACLIGSVLTQTPPSYTEAVADQSLGLTYGTETIKAGDTIGYKVPTYAPTLSIVHPRNSTYIALLVDTTADLSAPIPASLLWFQQDVTFPSLSSTPSVGITNRTARVPYLAPSNIGHAYVALLYPQSEGFEIPADFPYNNAFRKGFSVSRMEVDFHEKPVAANWFVLGSDCSRGR